MPGRASHRMEFAMEFAPIGDRGVALDRHIGAENGNKVVPPAQGECQGGGLR